jgi:hypothetical protein
MADLILLRLPRPVAFAKDPDNAQKGFEVRK